jgi:putative toxin-antitoxin system antitoxin component (TIGR02293 family)
MAFEKISYKKPEYIERKINAKNVVKYLTIVEMVVYLCMEKMKKYRALKPKVKEMAEPIALYAYPNTFFDLLQNILGGKKAVPHNFESEMDLVRQSEKGIKMISVKSVSDFLGISLEKMSQLLNVSLRTFQRKKEQDIMSASISQKTIDLAEVAAKGIEVFGDKAIFNLWLTEEVKSLGNKKPIELLNTSTGTRLVMQTLGRLQYGVYA